MSLLNPYQRFEPIDVTERQTNFALANPNVFQKQEILITQEQKAEKQLTVEQRYNQILNDLDDLANEVGLYHVELNVKLIAQCRSCGREFQYDSEIDQVDPSYFYCGRNERCLP